MTDSDFASLTSTAEALAARLDRIAQDADEIACTDPIASAALAEVRELLPELRIAIDFLRDAAAAPERPLDHAHVAFVIDVIRRACASVAAADRIVTPAGKPALH